MQHEREHPPSSTSSTQMSKTDKPKTPGKGWRGIILSVFAIASACSGSAPPLTPPKPAATTAAASAATTDPLPSWNDSAAKKAIVDFVRRVTGESGPNFVSPAERIATFDNDGTLWSEQPVYVQMAFAFDRVKALAPKHPEWKQDWKVIYPFQK